MVYLHHIAMIGSPGLVLLLLSAILVAKCLQLCHGTTCLGCILEDLDQTTQMETRGSQTTCDSDYATREREKRFA